MIFTRYIVPLLLLVTVMACSSTNQVQNDENKYKEVPVPDQFISSDNPRPDVWAKYPGGKEILDRYVRMNTIIPEKARKDGYEGRVMLSYEVDEEGRTGNIEVLMSPHPDITEMYQEIILDMKRWQPAILNNDSVSQRYYIISLFRSGVLPESQGN
jgi:TonB family protein